MITKEQLVAIVHVSFGRQFPDGTIADPLEHHSAVRHGLDLDRRRGRRELGPTDTGLLPLLRKTLEVCPEASCLVEEW